MSEHSQHLAQLEQILAEDDARARFEASTLCTCSTCREIVEEHLRLVDELGELATDEQASLRAADSLEGKAGRAEEAFREHVLTDLGQDPSDPTGRRALLVAIVAAAAVLIVMGLDLFTGASPKDDGRVLGDGSILVHPRGTVDSYTPFRWNVERPENGWFVVTVVGQGEAEGFELESQRLHDREWTPDEEPGWPDEIRWTLEVFLGTGSGDVDQSYVEWAAR